ncbi:hypothetical protein, partial [Rhizobium leguminosarum]|uniref:hypothetical protein n=1 Tax=Rhizobium leguminosarum TaxID=384 RepID=UPI003F965A0E
RSRRIWTKWSSSSALASLGWGSARTRFDAELTGDLSAAGVVELAWTMGLIHWDTDPKPGWYDANDEAIAEEEIYERFHDE